MAAGQAQLLTTQVQLLRTLQATTGELETAIPSGLPSSHGPSS